MTNKSCEDLVHKKTEDLTPVVNHKLPEKQTGIKRAIKQFKIDTNKLTGLKNFAELSPDPLALPAYALPSSENTNQIGNNQYRQGSSRESQAQGKPFTKLNDQKQKRPDDKADRTNRKGHENRRLENKLAIGKQQRSLRQDSKTNDNEGGASKATPADQTGPSNDLFYKHQKDSERNALSGNEDDLWDEPDSVVAEVKANKK